MIYGFLVAIFITGVIVVMSALGPGVTFTAGVISAAAALGAYLALLDLFLPITELIDVLQLSVALLIGLFSARLVFYVISLIRGNAMPGQR